MASSRHHVLHPLAASISLALSGPAPAVTMTVDGTTCDLASALVAANTDTAQGGCPAGSGADTLNLTAPEYTLTAADNGLDGLPSVTSTVTVNGDPDGDGQRAVVQRSSAPGTPPFRLITVSGGTLTLNRVRITGGLAPNSAGGGIANGFGELVLRDCIVSGNSARFGGGIASFGGRLTVNDSTVSGNQADFGGGVQSEDEAVVTLTNTTVAGNTARSSGGGIEIWGEYVYGEPGPFGSATLINSTVSGNTAGEGGGLSLGGSSWICRGADYRYDCTLQVAGAKVTLISSTVSRNTAATGGALVVGPDAAANLNHSTVTANRAIDGGGIFFHRSYEGSIYFGRGVARLTNSLVGGNPEGGDCTNTSPSPPRITGFVTFSGTNLIADGSCDAAAKGALTGDAKLGPLLDNGGPTFTHALLRASPAIDAAGGMPCSGEDQRGQSRPQGAGCDLGAYEVTMSVAPAVRPLMTFFDQAVQTRTLEGAKYPNWHVLQAVRRQLLLAGDQHRHGAQRPACWQLYRTLQRIDGDGDSPDANDYVTGPEAPALAEQVAALRDRLGCR